MVSEYSCQFLTGTLAILVKLPTVFLSLRGIYHIFQRVICLFAGVALVA